MVSAHISSLKTIYGEIMSDYMSDINNHLDHAVVGIVTNDNPFAKSFYDRQNSFYISQRGEASGRYVGLFGIPGGKVERSDYCNNMFCICGLANAIIREVSEEMGVMVTSENIRLAFRDDGIQGCQVWYFTIDIGGMMPDPVEMNQRKMYTKWLRNSNISEAIRVSWYIPEIYRLEGRIREISKELSKPRPRLTDRIKVYRSSTSAVWRPIETNDWGIQYDTNGNVKSYYGLLSNYTLRGTDAWLNDLKDIPPDPVVNQKNKSAIFIEDRYNWVTLSNKSSWYAI